MVVSKKSFHNNYYKLKGPLKKKGIDCWRYFFYGTNSITGDIRCFFIELLIENPAVSPNEICVRKTNAPKLSEEEIQKRLMGLSDDLSTNSNDAIIPSFASVRAGVLGSDCKLLKSLYKASDFKSGKNFDIRIADCIFNDNELIGKISVPRVGYNTHAVSSYECGSMLWNLTYERKIDSKPYISKDDKAWFPSGMKIDFSGKVKVDDSEYIITPADSFGYSDKNWGKGLCEPFFHINSSKLTSLFSGKTLSSSCFTVHGVLDESLFAFVTLEDEVIEFGVNRKYSNYEAVFDCIQTPNEDDKIHWTVSIHNKVYILDIDIYCPASEMVVREYELPKPNAKNLKVLTGAFGTGEIRLYKKVKKNIELIQHCEVDKAFCEYGCPDK